ncbi:MAG: 23S rRNA (guanosine(2251)-2'-O)-methyltransferase RlmB, partial [Bacteroidetes bacterium]
ALPYQEWDWKKPTLLLLGSEDKGLDSAYLAQCDALLTIAHAPQVESLNVSAAAAILLAEAYRNR